MRVDEIGQAKSEIDLAERVESLRRFVAFACAVGSTALIVATSVSVAVIRGTEPRNRAEATAEAAPKLRDDQITATTSSLADVERLTQKMHRQMDGIEEKLRIIVGQSTPRWSAKVYDADDPEFLRAHPGLSDPLPPRITK